MTHHIKEPSLSFGKGSFDSFIRRWGLEWELAIALKTEDKVKLAQCLSCLQEMDRHRADKRVYESCYSYLEDVLKPQLVRLASEDSAVGCDWRGSVVPDEVGTVPTTMELETLRYLYWLSATLKFRGVIVEFGAWMGASTLAIALGAQHGNDRKAHSMWIYDSFVWQPWMMKYWPRNMASTQAKVGDCYASRVMTTLGRVGDNVRLIRGQLMPLRRFSKPSHQIALVHYDMGSDYEMVSWIYDYLRDKFVDQHTVFVFSEYSHISSGDLWRFCAENRHSLRPLHKPMSSAKAFLFHE